MVKMLIIDLFNVKAAKSKGFESYEQGKIPFVTNGIKNNGIVGYVEPKEKDKIFLKNALCVSAFCEVTVQKTPFLPRGNGGSGLIVLEPKKLMTIKELVYYASYINSSHKWRFSYGRMVSKDRLSGLDIEPFKNFINFDNPEKFLPKKSINNYTFEISNLIKIQINSMFNVTKGEGGYRENLDVGKTPLISATNEANGVIGLVDLKPIFKAPAITVERVSGTALIQIEDFVTVPDDISVLFPKDDEMPLSCMFYVASMINQQKWRFSYARKLTPTRLGKLEISLPFKNEKVDYKIIDNLLQSLYGWDEIKKTITSSA